jgi:hypothetical protein
MLACFVTYAVLIAHPVSLVQLKYPTHRVTITTTSGYNVTYTLKAGAPVELQRAYKVLQLAEREVLITEALQLLRAEIVANERKLENLRAVKLASYLSDAPSGSRLIVFDPSLHAPLESTLKAGLSILLVEDARIERALLALDRLVDAHRQLHQTLISVANLDRQSAGLHLAPIPLPPLAAAPAAPAAPNRLPTAVADAEKAEKAAADAEAVAEARERDARQKERAAEAAYRDSQPTERPATKAAWLKARDAWEEARREWDAAREKWQIARDQLDAARKASRTPPTEKVVRPTVKPTPNMQPR